ncbi:uncharacterized protein DNG_05469 [Cephalotrichum gorgonifer]|uniref:Uncharacterized protein n=1 Tax=Cephalotrichum gorgonifer TaxID=2041049 RepID=A0AAE8MZQ6_9PEZI|nr:uncharacterized protein DNG_05469 [Cephalotrichum gorgonifer]
MDKKKTVFQLDTPFSAIPWPAVETADQDTILELLCSLLEPLGQHRRRHLQPSKGKGAKKRKRNTPSANSSSDIQQVPATPEISKYVDVGLASISRGLEQLSSAAELHPPVPPEEQSRPTESDAVAYSVIFVARSGQSTAFHCHYPQMVAVASRSPSCSHPIRLVGFSAPCAERLCVALGVPRVSAIGLRDGAPNAGALLDYVREHVAPVSMSWISPDPSQALRYLGANIKAVETVKNDIPSQTPTHGFDANDVPQARVKQTTLDWLKGSSSDKEKKEELTSGKIPERNAGTRQNVEPQKITQEKVAAGKIQAAQTGASLQKPPPQQMEHQKMAHEKAIQLAQVGPKSLVPTNQPNPEAPATKESIQNDKLKDKVFVHQARRKIFFTTNAAKTANGVDTTVSSGTQFMAVANPGDATLEILTPLKIPVAKLEQCICENATTGTNSRGLSGSKWADPGYQHQGRFPRNTAILSHKPNCPIRAAWEKKHPLESGASPATYDGADGGTIEIRPKNSPEVPGFDRYGKDVAMRKWTSPEHLA